MSQKKDSISFTNNGCYSNVLSNNIWFDSYVYLIIITSVPIMCHDMSKKFFFNNFIKKKIMKEIVDNCSSKKHINIALFVLHSQQIVCKHHQNISLT